MGIMGFSGKTINKDGHKGEEMDFLRKTNAHVGCLPLY